MPAEDAVIVSLDWNTGALWSYVWLPAPLMVVVDAAVAAVALVVAIMAW